MNRDDIIIRKAVVHILDSLVGLPVLSDQELDCGPDLYDFFRAHLEKVTSNDDIKKCTFEDHSAVKEILQGFNGETFLDISRQLAVSLYEIMNGNVEIPPADVVILWFRHSERDYLGILKMNYKTSYTHYTSSDLGENTNDIILQKAILPSEGQKLSEAAVIALDDYQIMLLEKKYDINGQKVNYLSTMFLECHGRMSSKARIQAVTKAIDQVDKKFFDEDDIERKVEVKKVLYNEFEEQGSLSVSNVKEKLFKDNEEMAAEFEEKLEKYNLADDTIEIQNNVTVKKFGRQVLKTDTGIEISIPMEVYENGDDVEFVTNPDGSISVILKNIGKLTSS